MLDQFDAFDKNPEVNNARVARACEDFKNDYPDYYGTEENTRELLAWLTKRGVPITRLNLSEAYEQLMAIGDVLTQRSGIVEHVPADTNKQGDRGITKVGSLGTVKINFPIGSDAQRNLVGQQPHRMREIMGEEIAAATAHLVELRDSSEIGKPVSPALRYEYGASLRQQRALKTPSASTAEARAVVALYHPDIKRDSPEFNRLVAETLEQ
jgi:hypothetical protein